MLPHAKTAASASGDTGAAFTLELTENRGRPGISGWPLLTQPGTHRVGHATRSRRRGGCPRADGGKVELRCTGRARSPAQIAHVMLGSKRARRPAARRVAARAPGDGRRQAGRRPGVAVRVGGTQVDPPAVSDGRHRRGTDRTDRHRDRDRELDESTVAGAPRRAEINPDVWSTAATAVHMRGLLTGVQHELERAVELFGDGRRPLALASSAARSSAT